MRQGDQAMTDEDDVLGELTDIYLEAALNDVASLESCLSRAQSDSKQWEDACLEMRRTVHNIKGQGTSFGYPLMTKIGESLSHLLKTIETPSDPQLRLIEAHITALRLVMDQNIKGSGGEQGEALVTRLEDLVMRLAAA